MGARPAMAALAALTAMLLAVGPVTALTLGPIVTIAEWGVEGPLPVGSIAAEGSRIYVVYPSHEGGYPTPPAAVRLRRSTDAGATFEAAITLSHDGVAASRASIAARAGIVHVAWIETDAANQARAWYRRSPDGGATWSDAVPMTPPSSTTVSSSRVFAGPTRVLYTYADAGQVMVRRSVNGGLSFAAPQLLGRSVIAGPVVTIAFGTGVVYAAWESAPGTVRLRSSTTGGIGWKPATTMQVGRWGTHFRAQPSLAASGSTAILALTTGIGSHDYVAARRTANAGRSWSAARLLTPAGAMQPLVLRAGSRWWLAWEWTGPDPDNGEVVVPWIRTSTDGISWTPRRDAGAFSRCENDCLTVMGGLAYASASRRVWLIWAHILDTNAIYARGMQ